MWDTLYEILNKYEDRYLELKNKWENERDHEKQISLRNRMDEVLNAKSVILSYMSKNVNK